MTDLKDLLILCDMATPGPWELQTSNSYRRVGTQCADGDVVRGTNHPLDNWPDLAAKAGTLEFIAAADPDTVRALALEVLAWRERYPQQVYRPQDDCVALR
ncbi:MAG: hypothetical protein JO253_03350 [Alphaproteobacteria bacterium]|nr:hypothetical protein [Alphaproteobacteria bacterium]